MTHKTLFSIAAGNFTMASATPLSTTNMGLGIGIDDGVKGAARGAHKRTAVVGGTGVAMGIVPPQRKSFASALSIYAKTYLVHGISTPFEMRTPCIYAVILYVTIYCSASTEEKPK